MQKLLMGVSAMQKDVNNFCKNCLRKSGKKACAWLSFGNEYCEKIGYRWESHLNFGVGINNEQYESIQTYEPYVIGK